MAENVFFAETAANETETMKTFSVGVLKKAASIES